MSKRKPMRIDPPLVVPVGCSVQRILIDDWPAGYRLTDATRGIAILVTQAVERDGQIWKHVSVSRRDKRLPSYDDLAWARSLVLDSDEHAYQVFPPRSEYVNMAPMLGGLEVLHLFVPIGHRPLPDFRPDTERNVL